MQYKSGYITSSGYSTSAYGAPGALEPFVQKEQWNLEIAEACGVGTATAANFVESAGGYSTFEISKAPTGPWTASLSFDCTEIGSVNVFVRGNGGLVLQSSAGVQDNNGYCDGCP